MKHIQVLLLWLFFQQLACGQALNTLEKSTENHVLVAGTNIYIAPPPAFESSTDFKGFQHTTDPVATIMVMEIPGPFAEIAKGFETDRLKAAGMTLLKKTPITLNGIPGIWVDMEQLAAGRLFSKSALLFGNAQKTTIINGICLKDSVLTAISIQTALKSTYIDTSMLADPRQALPFTLDESAGKLKFANMAGNAAVFTRDAQFPSKSADELSLAVEKSYGKMEIANKRAFCTLRLSKYPDHYVVESEKKVTPVEIDGLEGFELFAKNDLVEGTPQQELLQIILFEKDGGYYIMTGSYHLGDDNAVKDIEAVIKTFKRK